MHPARATLRETTPHRVWRKGADYFDTARVTVVRASHEELVAEVRGGQLYEVAVQWQDGALTYACSCPAPDPCKHIVAAVLAWGTVAVGAATARSAITQSLSVATSYDGLAYAAEELDLIHELEMPLVDALEGAPSSPEVTALRGLCKREPELTVGDIVSDRSLQRTLKASGLPARAFVAVLRGVLEAATAELPEVPATAAALRTWAVEHDAEALLGLTPAQLASSFALRRDERFYYGSRQDKTLREVLIDASALPPQIRARLLRDVAQAARLLHADRARALARITSLTVPNLQPLERLFTDLREHHRRLCDELPLPAEAEGVEVRVQSEPLGFSVVFPDGQRFAWSQPPAAVTIRLERWRQGIEVDSSCGAPCGHSLKALEGCLAWLGDDGQASAHAKLAAELKRPAWERVLAVLEAEPEARAPAVVSWRVGWLHDTLRVEPYLHQPKARGGYSRGSVKRVDALLQQPQLEAVDRLAAELLRGLHYTSSVFGITWQALLALVRHPRIFRNDAPEQALTIERGELEVTGRDDEAGTLLLEASIEGHVLGLEELDLLLAQANRENGRAVWLSPAPGPRCRLLELSVSTLRLLTALRRYGSEFPRESHPALLDILSKRGRDVAVVLPEAIRGDELIADESPTVRARLEPDGALLLSSFVRPLGDDTELPSGQGPQEIARLVNGTRQWVRRDLVRERQRAEAVLRDAGAEADNAVARVTPVDRALDVIGRLEANSDLRFEWANEPLRRMRPATMGDLKLRVTEKRDWFGLEGSLTVDGHKLEIAALIEHVRQGRRWVQAGPRAFVELSAALRGRLEELEGLTTVSRTGLELSIASAPVLEGLKDELASFIAAPRWTSLLERFRDAHTATPPLPTGFAAELRDYQRDGFTWLARLAGWSPGAVLADDMGLGKTVQALALLQHRAKLGPALVVAPTSVCSNWLREASRFAPSLDVKLYHGQGRAEVREGLAAGRVLVTSWSLLVKDRELLGNERWATVVLDEAQAIKNADTARAKAARGLQADFCVALTGTPVENHLGELWSVLRVVFPGLLGSLEQFRERFAVPIERGRDPERQRALSRVIRGFVLRRSKAEVAKDLPAKTEVSLRVDLSEQERQRYDDARQAAVAHLSGVLQTAVGEQQARFQVLAALTRLRQLACHVKLVDPTWSGPASKLERLVELVCELKDEGHRVLVFSQFTRHLELAREALNGAGVSTLYLDGGTPQAERSVLVDRFQAGAADAFLISLKAGGTGLNLTAADYVVHLDPWWNPAVEDQASDRAHRIGQTRPVTVYRLVAGDTIEEQILSLHAHKRELVESVLEGTGAGVRVSSAELLELLREGQSAASGDVARPPEKPQAAKAKRRAGASLRGS